jgi:hypothetical protein
MHPEAIASCELAISRYSAAASVGQPHRSCNCGCNPLQRRLPCIRRTKDTRCQTTQHCYADTSLTIEEPRKHGG